MNSFSKILLLGSLLMGTLINTALANCYNFMAGGHRHHQKGHRWQ